MKTLGIVLLIVGALMMAITGFNYITKEKVVDLGGLEINKERSHPIQLLVESYSSVALLLYHQREKQFNSKLFKQV
jgi:hypothetical protein